MITSVASTAMAASGPFSVTTGSYKFLDRSEPLVATDRNIDLWAEVYRPKTLENRPFPLIIFLHGNHYTCGYYDASLGVRVDDRADYTTTGKCPTGYVVAPSHLGYAYMAEELASYGYIVVSINANRGINLGQGTTEDDGLNLMRGRLVLRHLALLSDWNKGGGEISPPATLGFNPVGTMDFNEVGLMGHSRGGEGVRAALQQLRDTGSAFPALIGKISIRSIFEIAPVDGQTSRVLDANGVNSMILLPACDGDVSNLDGMRVFDRVFLNTSPDTVPDFHGTTYVYGADHDAYNTEWQQADSIDCLGTTALFPQAGVSINQQITARDQLVPFFRATVGKQAQLQLARIFDPLNPAAPTVTAITDVDRGYLSGPLGTRVELLETFSQPTGTSDSGVATTAVGVGVVNEAASVEHYPGTNVATISWTASSPATRYFQVNFAANKDVSDAKSLSFRTALRCYDTICSTSASADGEMSYAISLVDASGRISNPISTSDFMRISRPVGNTAVDAIGDTRDNLHSTLYTVQIPLEAMRGVNLHQVKGVRFVFQEKPVGIVDIADLAVVKKDPLGFDLSRREIARDFRRSGTSLIAMASRSASEDGNVIKAVPHVAASQAETSSVTTSTKTQTTGTTDIVLTSKRHFAVGDSLPKLTIGGKVIKGGTVSADGMTMTIPVPTATYNQLPSGADVSLSVKASAPVWKFGALRK